MYGRTILHHSIKFITPENYYFVQGNTIIKCVEISIQREREGGDEKRKRETEIATVKL